MKDHTDTVRRFLAASHALRVDEFISYLREDALYVDPLLPGPLRGRTAIRDVLEYCHGWGSNSHEVLSLFGAGNYVVLEQYIKGSVKHPPKGMSEAVVGRRYEFGEADVFEFDDLGLIARETIYMDVLRLQKQLGQPWIFTTPSDGASALGSSETIEMLGSEET